ncbi:Dabb family protein [Primorskyibacter sp. S187A]|uniref:Dabb family protein n=1 Tax=Primorskyibacter sp. S187A TaxID=3415130 RepID=UPI003C798125
MLRHIVLVSFKSEASEPQLAAWRNAVTQMCETSDDVVSFSLGTNVGSGPNHHDAALVADFEGMEAFRRYVSSDAHKAYVEDHARHVTAKLAAIQHEI